MNERVGLRPCRKGGVRLELEHTDKGKVRRGLDSAPAVGRVESGWN